MPNKPSMDVYYKQGPSAYGFEMAKFAYEQGERDPNKLTWIDQAGGLLSYLDYLKGQLDVVEYAEKPTWITGTEGGPAGAAGPDYFKLGKTTTFEATPQGVMKTVNKPTGSFKIPNVLAGQSGITTTDFATAYKTKFGVAPSQTELNTFISQRKTTPLETIISNMAGITPESLETAKKINLPGETADFTQANAMVAGVSSLQNLINQLTPEDTTADKSKQDLLNKMASQTEELAKKSADQLTTEQSAELPALRKQFADINAQILSKMAEYKVLTAQEEGKPITMSSIIGATAQIAKVKASEIGLLQAQAQGLQGQITVAQDTVNRAIDLKYSTIENQLEVYQAQLNAIEPELNKEEKVQALAQQLLIDKYKQQVSDAETEETNIQKTMLEAISSGITDTNVLSSISNAKSYTEALQILGKNMPKEEVKATGGDGDSGGTTEKALTINQIEQFRRSYGWTPPFGYTQSELLQYMKDNPNATPEELEAGAKLAVETTPSETVKTNKNTIEGLKERTTLAHESGYTDEEIKDYIKQNYTTDELFVLAKSAGFSKWYTGKTTDIERMLDNII